MVSKNEAELFTLVVNDLYGELPSRILEVLFYRGRSTLAQLSRATSIDLRKTKHAICVLIQQNLLYHHTSTKGARETVFEANSTACYNLLRAGKAVALVGEQHGPAEEDVAQTLVLTGHARIEDLEKRVLARVARLRAAKLDGVNGASEAVMHAEAEEGAEPSSHEDTPLHQITSVAHLHQTLYNLLRADLLEVVGSHTFQSPEDIYRDIEDEVARTSSVANQIKRGAERDRVISDRYRDAVDEPIRLKRQLDPGPNYAVKRRRLTNGPSDHHAAGANGTAGNGVVKGPNGVVDPTAEHDPFEDDSGWGPMLNTNAIIRLNFDKCVLHLRNESLRKFVADAMGEAASHIFYALLNILTADVPKCGTVEETAGDGGRQRKASTAEIVARLDPTINVALDLGKAAPEDIDLASAERVRGAPGDDGDEDEDGTDNKPSVTANIRDGNHYDDDGDEDDSDEEMSGDLITLKPHTNSATAVTVQSQGPADDDADERTENVRQHLLILAESPQRFVRLCSRQGGCRWTVDMVNLLQRLREVEVDAVIEQGHGRQGLRLSRILRAKGKMEERPLMSMALLSKNDMHRRLLAMKTTGICELQEVPRDNTRLAAKTTFLWCYEEDRHRRNVLATTFKTMMHLWQRLETERQKCSLLLEFVARRDVRGQEKDVMIPEHYNKWTSHLEVEKRIMGQISRLEEVVSILRDY